KIRHDGPDSGPIYVREVGGGFRMGNTGPGPDAADDWSRPAHRVTVRGYYIQATEVTFGQLFETIPQSDLPECCMDVYRKVLKDERGDEPAARAHPAGGVTWRIAREYARRRHGLLPTEAQWEFAARSGAGGRQPFVWGEIPKGGDLSRLANVTWGMDKN